MRFIDDGNAAARHELVLFGRVAVHHIGDQVGPDAGVVHQGVALGRSTVGGDALAVTSGLQQEGQEVVLDPVGSVLETGVAAARAQAGFGFPRQQGIDTGRARLAAAVGALREHTQAAAVSRVLLDVEHAQAVGGEDALDGGQRQVGEMLVVDGVELVLRDQSQQMRELEGGDTFGLQQAGEAGDEIVDVRHMRQHVVGGGEVGLPALGDQFIRQPHTEEILHDGNALGARGGGGAGGRLDAGAGNAARLNVLQQIAVIGGDFDDMAGRIQTEARRHVGHIAFAVRQPAAGEAAEVGVIGVEQFIGLGEILGLHQPALFAHQHAQRKPFLRRVQALFGEIGVGRRCAAQIDKRQGKFGSAVTAFHLDISPRCCASRVMRPAL